MYKFFRIISNLAGIIGCIVAIFLLCNEYPSNDVKFDYIGFIIGILALLVTILVTWNIYSAIGIKQKVGKALSDIAEEIKKQIERNDKFRTEIAASIEDVKVQHTLVLERLESAEQAYEALFNATQAQVSALNEDNGNDFFQQYAHCQTALCAMLKCRHFPSDIRHNIKVLLSMMDGILKNREVSNSANDRLYDEDRKEFIQNMDDISKSSREEFSFEDRQKFMQVTAKAMQIFNELQ